MKLKPPINKNYCATVVVLDKFVDLPNCDNVKHAIIFGNSVIISKEMELGEIGLYFPIETKLSHIFLKSHNLYRKPELNFDGVTKNYFEESGRIKCMKFRGHKSEGFFIPMKNLDVVIRNYGLKIGDEFDYLDTLPICEKYVIKTKQEFTGKGSGKADVRISRIVNDQFRLHVDTSNLRKNITMISSTDIISLTYKLHGTSFVVGNVLVKEKLSFFEKVVKWLGANIKLTGYDTLYSSRRVIKNEYETKTNNHYYGYDLWAEIKKKLDPFLLKGITLYGEAVGYLESGEMIQKDYDYGAKPNEFNIYIYRITMTNEDGKVIEFSWGQVKDYCKKFGINHVPELYYGLAGKLFPISEVNHWNEMFLKMLEEHYLEKDCYMCTNKVPLEGIVVKVDKTFDCEPYKLKSFKFLERESKQLDTGIADIESQQSEI